MGDEAIWVVDDVPSGRYPVYTRGNIGEVFPEAVAPLSWSLGAREGSEPGWRDAFVRFGAFDHDEFTDGANEILGCFGGYGYLNVSVSRILAVRTPGLSPELIDQTFFGDSDAPPYRPQPTDESPRHTERIMQTLGWILTTDGLPELVDDQRMVDDLVRARPDFTAMTSAELVDLGRSRLRKEFRHLFAQHIHTTYCATVPLGIIQQVCTELGDPTMAMRLVAGVGDVDSAAPSWAMWDLGRLAGESPAVAAAFAAGIDGLPDRLRAEPEAAAFVAAFEEFLATFGSRGPNEWEMRSPTWGTHPELALAAIDRMRVSPADAAPQRSFERRAADRTALVEQLGAALAAAPEVQGQFLAACRAAAIFLAGRERSKTTIIKLVHETRLAFRELGRRYVDAGVLEAPEDVSMLVDAELDDFVADPAPFAGVIERRLDLFRRLQQLEPPFIVDGRVPPLDTWRRRGTAPVAVAVPGDVLTGIPGCPGERTGRARVVLAPEDAGDLDPGDVLIAPITDPSWTPLFVPATAVVVDVGAQASHAVIVARELGIPCVVSVADATRRIPDGALVRVDGTAGTVSLL